MIPGLSSLQMKLIGGAVAVLIVLGLVFGLRHYKSLAESRGETLALICQATRDASGQPKLRCAEVPKQIRFMGEAIGTLKTAIGRQNAAVEAMGDATAKARAEAERASRNAAERARGPEATSARLTASSRAGERMAKPCEPSNALKGAWQ